MIRIVKIQLDKYTKKCECSCIYTYSIFDIKSSSNGTNIIKEFVRCPECGRDNKHTKSIKDIIKEWFKQDTKSPYETL